MPFRSTFASALVPAAIAFAVGLTWGALRPDIESRTYFGVSFGLFAPAIVYVIYRVQSITAESRAERKKLQEQITKFQETARENRRLLGGSP